MNITLDDNPVQSSQDNLIPFASDSQKGTNYSSYNGSIVEIHVNKYKLEIEKY